MRTVPINHEPVVKWPVAPDEDAMAILDNHESITIAPCIWRNTALLNDKGCAKRFKTCLLLGSFALCFVENGMGRYVTKEEAKGVVRQSEEVGLVCSPSTRKGSTVCAAATVTVAPS